MASRGAYARIGSFAARRSAAGACRPRSLSRLRERVGVRVCIGTPSRPCLSQREPRSEEMR